MLANFNYATNGSYIEFGETKMQSFWPVLFVIGDSSTSLGVTEAPRVLGIQGFILVVGGNAAPERPQWGDSMVGLRLDAAPTGPRKIDSLLPGCLREMSGGHLVRRGSTQRPPLLGTRTATIGLS